jgi:DNA-binding MarR family transcriptional regulator
MGVRQRKKQRPVGYGGREELGLNAAEMARHLGVNTSSITRAIDRAGKQGHKQKA